MWSNNQIIKFCNLAHGRVPNSALWSVADLVRIIKVFALARSPHNRMLLCSKSYIEPELTRYPTYRAPDLPGLKPTIRQFYQMPN